ncbi:hypothetical protein SUGI_0131750 [Cryptomeria japonica]|nr:hypothetical protein SUGI_0131750 [Cryptomeria japonica]
MSAQIGETYLSTPKVSRNQSYCSTTQNISITHNISTSSGDICIGGYPIDQLVQLRQNTNANQISRAVAEGNIGYVKEMLTFIITDDLKIKGSSTITSIMLLNQLDIKDLTDLQERAAIVDRKKVSV